MTEPNHLSPDPTIAELRQGQIDLHVCFDDLKTKVLQGNAKIDALEAKIPAMIRDELGRLGWRAVGVLTVAVIGCASAVIASQYNLHQQTEAVTKQTAETLASKTPPPYTAEQAKADRDAETAAIVEAIRSIRHH